jgi:hypothetical protein
VRPSILYTSRFSSGKRFGGLFGADPLLVFYCQWLA